MRSIFSITVLLISLATIAGCIFYLYQLPSEDDAATEQVGTQDGQKSTTTFFTQPDAANIRACPPLLEMPISECVPIEQVAQNTRVALPYASLDEMPEWISFTWKGRDAYIHKSVLSTKPVLQDYPTKVVTTTNPLSEMAEHIEATKEVTEPTQEQLNDLVWLCNVAVSDVDCSINFYAQYNRDLTFRNKIDQKISALKE